MADPITGGLAALGGLAGIGSAYTQYQSAKEQGSAARAAAAYNAKLGNEDIALLEDQTAGNIASTRRDNYRQKGTSMANAAANGGLTGSALDVILSNTQEQELDILNMKYDTELQKRAIRNDIELGNMNARSASRAAKLAQAGAILGGISGAAKSGTQIANIA